ncbi:hypothetical protein AB0D59_33465 [Streptomyces sp. NPDC048417]
MPADHTDASGNSKIISRVKLSRPFSKFVQFRAPRGDPFQQLGIPTPT